MKKKSYLAKLLLRNAVNQWFEANLEQGTDIDQLKKNLAEETEKKVEIEKLYPESPQNHVYKFRLS